MIESRHPIILSFFLRIKNADGDNFDEQSSAIRAINISNDLYGNDTLSAFELARGFTKPVSTPTLVQALPNDIVTAHDSLQARRKLALMLRSKSMSEPVVTVGDTVEVYIKKDFEKRGEWSTAKPVLSVHQNGRSITVPGRNNQVRTIAFESTRLAKNLNELFKLLSEAMDHYELVLDDLPDSTNTKSIMIDENHNLEDENNNVVENHIDVLDLISSNENKDDSEQDNLPTVDDRVSV